MQVCELHFNPEDIERETSCFDEKTGRKLTAKLCIPRLRQGAVPSKLPNCPSYLSSATSWRESPDERRSRKEEAAIQSAFVESIADDLQQKQKIKFETLDELVAKLDFLDTFWTVIKQQESVLICHIASMPHPKITLSVAIDQNCAVKVFASEVEMKKVGSYSIPTCINDVDSLGKLLSNLKECNIEKSPSDPGRVIILLQLVISVLSLIQEHSFKHINTVKVICEQLRLMTLNKLEYSAEFMVFSSLLYNCSPQGYRLLRNTGHLILPSYSTVRRLTLSQNLNPALEQHDSNFLMYIKNKFKFLTQNDKTVTLMIDEIHIKQYFDYKGGNVVGSAFNTTEAAKSAFVFMLSSLLSKFKDVVHILPTKTIDAESLFTVIKQVIIGIEKIGFTVICVLTDNNSINRKAMSYFHSPPQCSTVYRHPAQNSRPLFFMFDSVHLLKCIRNNWINQKTFDKCMQFPDFSLDELSVCDSVSRICNAPFTTLKKLHSLEADSLLKHAYRLTLKALSPSNLEKQNVNLVVQIFNEYIVQALQTLGEKHNLACFDKVAKYIHIIYVWWTVMNVKSPYKGCRLNNKYATPLTKSNTDEKYIFLHFFLDWLNVWERMTEVTGKLTKETFSALKHTTTAILQITDYCIDELNMKYMLPGKFQTDQLEARFGKYRQLSGCNYNISVRQIFECEKKMRMMSVLRIPLHDQNVSLNFFEETEWEKIENNDISNMEKYDVEVTQGDIEECMDLIQVITYLAGYCCFAVSKKIKCELCKELLTCNEDIESLPDIHSYIQGISRGALLYPDDAVVTIIMYNYIVINKLTQNPEFAKSINQRNVATEISLNVLEDNDAFLPMNNCDNDHSIDKIQKMLLWASTNALLNNFCAKENDFINQNKKSVKKRKLQTLM